MNAVDILTYGQRAVDAALDGLAPGEWTTPGACGRWSVKEIVAHLASYELVIEEILTGFGGDGPTPRLDRFLALGPAFNDVEVARRAEHSAEAVRDELARAAERSIAAVAAIPADHRRLPGTLPWYGAEYALDDLLVYMAYGHKREHAAQVALVADRSSAAKTGPAVLTAAPH